MIILGFTNGHDCGASIVRDGRVVAAVNEERLNRVKVYWGFPWLSIREVMRVAGVKPGEIDAAAYGGLADACNIWQVKNQSEGLQYPSLFGMNCGAVNLIEKRAYRPLLRRGIIKRGSADVALKYFRKALRRIGIAAPLAMVEHHAAHAASAYYSSGRENATTITIDGIGDLQCATVSKCKGTEIERIASTHYHGASPGAFYANVTNLLGFRPLRHEGKVTGLAAYGNPEAIEFPFLGLANGGMEFKWENYEGYFPRPFDSLSNFLLYIRGGLGIGATSRAYLDAMRERAKGAKREDVAAAAQKKFEEVICRHVEKVLEATGNGNLCLAGGVFANVKLNQRIHEIDGVSSIMVHQHMGDGGLAVGAALHYYREKQGGKCVKLPHAYLGPEYGGGEIERELTAAGLEYEEHGDIDGKVGEVLAEGDIVARYGGRMEYGPRALGNRSILCQPTDPSVNDWLNKKLKRTEFMPFAPVTLGRYAKKCYKGMKGAEQPAENMIITFGCTDWLAENCPAVVHVDGTARPQVIERGVNPGYYRVLEQYHKITGLTTLINTSFNIHEEPIVCTPGDAVRAFKLGHLEYLAIGDFLVRNKSDKN
ncbi:MAG: carbamoyltransferase C-terminal domain-containing protein [Candidatus Diapherotrites archaeon]